MSTEPISSDTAAALRKLAGRVTVAADVDPVLREELVGHLEDKLLDYTSGRLRPSEADALLLVERHLGDPGRLSDLLARAHGQIVTPSVVDRFLTLLTATAAVYAAVDGLIAVADRALPNNGHSVRLIHPIATVALLWGALALGRRRVPLSRRTRVIWAAVACLACLTVPVTQDAIGALFGSSWFPFRLQWSVFHPYGLLGNLTVGALWLWWGTRSRPWQTAAPAIMLAWIAVAMVADLFRPHWMDGSVLNRSRPTLYVPLGPWPQMGGPYLRWILAYCTNNVCTLLWLVSLLLATRLAWDRLAQRSTPRALTAR